jgi:antitoxin component of RelBE/YafQ-DinJ toxin-antitoxin module
MTSMNIDWYDELNNNPDKWENVTQRVLREILEDKDNERFKEVAERLEVLKEDETLQDYYEESINAYEPMMNYGHILETEPDDLKVLEVALNTNCSIMFNTEEEVYYIVLNGGGMDLSQDIGLSYILLEKWIPYDLITSISNQEGLSISKENFKILRSNIIEQSKNYTNKFKELSKRWKLLK